MPQAHYDRLACRAPTRGCSLACSTAPDTCMAAGEYELPSNYVEDHFKWKVNSMEQEKRGCAARAHASGSCLHTAACNACCLGSPSWRQHPALPTTCAQGVAELDIAFERIIGDPAGLLAELAARLGLRLEQARAAGPVWLAGRCGRRCVWLPLLREHCWLETGDGVRLTCIAPSILCRSARRRLPLCCARCPTCRCRASGWTR